MSSSDKFFSQVKFSGLTAADNRFVCLHSVRPQIPQYSYDVFFLQSESMTTCLKNENVVQTVKFQYVEITQNMTRSKVRTIPRDCFTDMLTVYRKGVLEDFIM